MKIKDLTLKISTIGLSIIGFIIAFFISNKYEKNESLYSFMTSFICTVNVLGVQGYFLGYKKKKINAGMDNNARFFYRIEKLLLIGQVSLLFIMYLFYIDFWASESLSEALMFVAIILYGNYYPSMPMPTENVSVFLEDEDVWRKFCQLRGRLLFGFGIFGLSLVIYFAPEGLGKYTIMIIYGTMAVTFIITYFYAKSQYFKKYND